MLKLLNIIEIYKNSNIAVRAGIWFLCVTIIDKGIAIITQPIINRILSVEEVGIFGVYNSWKSIISVIATFNLFGGVLEVYLTKESQKKSTIVASLCTLSLTISIVFWLLFFSFGDCFSRILVLKKVYLVYMALAVTSEAIIQFWSVPKRFEYSYKSYAILVVGLFFVKSLLSVLLALYYTEDRVLGRIFGLTTPSVIVAFLLLLRILRNIKSESIKSYWKKGLLFNLPLIPHYLASILLASSDKVMIQQLVGSTEAGLYTVAYSFAHLTLIVFNALNNAYNPLSMKAIKEKNYITLKQITEILVLFSVIFSIFMMLLAPEGLWLLGGESYLITLKIIPVLMLGVYFSSFYFIFSNVEFVYEKNKLIFPITMIGSSLNIILNYWLIPFFGYEGAAYTTFIGYFFIAFSHYYVSRRIVKEDIFDIKRIIMYIGLLFIGSLLSIILYRVDDFIRYMIIILLLSLLCRLLYKHRYNLTKKLG